MNSDLIDVLKQHVSIITEQQAETISKLAQERSFLKGEYFLQAPKICTEIGFVLSGVFRYYTIDEEGNETTSMFIDEGNLFTDLESFHKNIPSEGFIQAETNAKVLVFDKKVHAELSTSINEWAVALKTISQNRLVSQLKFSRKIVEHGALASYQLFLSTYPTIANRVPDNHLASYLGISKFTMSRIKKELSKK